MSHSCVSLSTFPVSALLLPPSTALQSDGQLEQQSPIARASSAAAATGTGDSAGAEREAGSTGTGRDNRHKQERSEITHSSRPHREHSSEHCYCPSLLPPLFVYSVAVASLFALLAVTVWYFSNSSRLRVSDPVGGPDASIVASFVRLLEQAGVGSVQSKEWNKGQAVRYTHATHTRTDT